MPVRRTVYCLFIFTLVLAYQVAATLSEKHQGTSVVGLTAGQIEEKLQVHCPYYSCGHIAFDIWRTTASFVKHRPSVQ